MQQVQHILALQATKVGLKNIEKARPYHEALFTARKVCPLFV